MRLNVEQVPPANRSDFTSYLVTKLREITGQLNRLTEGQLSASHSAASAAPTTGTYAVGDFVPNTGRGAELGAPGSKYTLQGWVCKAESPLAFLEVRCPTGN